jgi:hypothetical protein
MGMIVRVAFNNQNWMGRCTNADSDPRLCKCQNVVYKIGNGRFQTDEQGNCTSGCREETLCTEYFWQGYRGNVSAQKARGAAFFVYPDCGDGSLVLWGRSRVERVEGCRVHFGECQPLPEDMWLAGLRARDFLGADWRSGTYRFLDETQETWLANKLADRGR